jgi:ApaG protein
MISFLQDTTEPSSGIVVRAVSAYMPDESDLSDPGDRKYVFAYHIEIENLSTRTVKLLSRHWWITDAVQAVREVQGEGVVGQQPVIAPGQVFSYSSWCVMPTSSGWMKGTYSMLGANGETIEVPIPPFSLATPSALN